MKSIQKTDHIINKGDIFIIKDPDMKKPVKNNFEIRKLIRAEKIEYSALRINFGTKIESTDINGNDYRTDEYRLERGRYDFDIYTPNEFLLLTTSINQATEEFKKLQQS